MEVISVLKDRKFIVFGIDHYNPLGILEALVEKGLNQTLFVYEERHLLLLLVNILTSFGLWMIIIKAVRYC